MALIFCLQYKFNVHLFPYETSRSAIHPLIYTFTGNTELKISLKKRRKIANLFSFIVSGASFGRKLIRANLNTNICPLNQCRISNWRQNQTFGHLEFYCGNFLHMVKRRFKTLNRIRWNDTSWMDVLWTGHLMLTIMCMH